MRTNLISAVCALGGIAGMFLFAGCASSPAGSPGGGGTATVRFVQPERYTDLQRSNTDVIESRKVLLPKFDQCIQQEAARSLPVGWHLTVEFLDIDQAGWIPPASPRRTRVQGDNRPARLVLKYELRDPAGTMTKSGQDTLTGFVGDNTLSPQPTEELATEKRLLREWLRRLAT